MQDVVNILYTRMYSYAGRGKSTLYIQGRIVIQDVVNILYTRIHSDAGRGKYTLYRDA